MCLDVAEVDVIRCLGHDGQERVFEDLPGNKSLRGVHPQELLDVCRKYNHWLVYIEANPILGQDMDHLIKVYGSQHDNRFYNQIAGHRGILRTGTHAVAFDEEGTVYDPNGKLATLEDYGIDDTWLVIPESNQL